MPKSLNIFAAVTVTALAVSLAIEPAKAATISVYQTFDTEASAQADGWAVFNNTINGNNYGWNLGNQVSGTGGQAGGIFTRTIIGSTGYYADLTIGQSGTVAGTLNRATDSLVLSGLLRLSNSDFDGNFRLGYFNTGTFGSSADPFLGISFGEPLTPTGPFRGSITTNGTTSAPINLNQDQTYGFNLTWTPTTGGAGTLAGTLAGQPVSVTAGLSATGIYTAFGITNGYALNSNSALTTNGSYFDNITYSVVPEPTQMVFVAGVGAALGMWRMRKLRRNGRGSNATAC